MEEAQIRKQIWERKDLADAKVAEPEFLELPDEEQNLLVRYSKSCDIKNG